MSLQHIPIDDINDHDIEEDLREIARIDGDDTDILPKIIQVNLPAPHTSDDNRAGPSRYKSLEKDANEDNVPAPPAKDRDLDITNIEESPLETKDTASLPADQDKENEAGPTIFDFPKVRQKIEEARNKLVLDSMSGPAWTGDSNQSDNTKHKMKHLHQKGLSHRKTEKSEDDDDDTSKKTAYIKSVDKEHERKIHPSTTTPSVSKDVKDLLPSEHEDELEENEEKMEKSLKDMAEGVKYDKYNGVEQKNEDSDKQEDIPYDEDTKKSEINKPSSDAERKKEGENQGQTFQEKSGYHIPDQRKDEEIKGVTTTPAPRKVHKKHHKKLKHKKDRRPKAQEFADLHNEEVVAHMVDEDAKAFTNETAHWSLVQQQKDVIDIPVSDSGQLWKTKIHGHRDVVLAGAIIMVFGIIVIIVGLVSVARRRFLESTKRKRNTNNNRRYQRLGSASETEVLRKPQRSLFQTDSSSGDSESSSSDETIYHQKTVYRNF